MAWEKKLLRALGIASCFTAILTASLNGGIAQAEPTEPALLTNCIQVLSLSAERADKRVPVLVTGVVTAAEPDWIGRFFVQDQTGGVFVDNRSNMPPGIGDLVQVSGASHPGAFAPTITRPHWKKVGTAEMPRAKVAPIEQIMAGTEDSQRVEISGIVRAVYTQPTRTRVTIASSGYRLNAYLPPISDFDPQTLIGATVRARGTVAAYYNAKLRHLLKMILYVPRTEDFVVEKAETVDPFSEPVVPLDNIAQYRRDSSPGKRVHVRGVLTFQRVGQDLFLKDDSGGLHVRCAQATPFAIGDTLEAVGFSDIENFLPVLGDAIVRKTPAETVPVVAEGTTIETLQAGLHHAEFMALEGTLIDRAVRMGRRTNGVQLATTILFLQTTNLTFTAQYEGPQTDTQPASIPIGSRIEVSGVCLTENGEDGRFKTLQVFLPTARSFRIIHEPSWWTPARLGIALAIFFVATLLAVGWTIVISRKNSELNVLVVEKEKAKTELQNAHDQLEVRVKERTEQLKVQIAARKESELQFKGVLTERTRLAQELHDTLEQMLASIALQLDTSAKLASKDAEAASRHFELARNILSQSQVDVRRSVWDLRARALEQFDLRGALVANSRQITDGTGIEVLVNTHGRERPLPEIIEDNLLRIAQEALTNIIKHSHATRAIIEVDYGPQNVVLQVVDNGKGFATDECVGTREGHFGLQGISERAQRLSGRAIITSKPNTGTTVRVEIPIDLAQKVAVQEAALSMT